MIKWVMILLVLIAGCSTQDPPIPKEIPDDCIVTYGGEEIGAVYAGLVGSVAVPYGTERHGELGFKLMAAGFDTKEQAIKWLVESGCR